jgi:hypothetical protein
MDGAAKIGTPSFASTGRKKFPNGVGRGWILLECKLGVLGNVISNINRLSENPTIYR